MSTSDMDDVNEMGNRCQLNWHQTVSRVKSSDTRTALFKTLWYCRAQNFRKRTK